MKIVNAVLSSFGMSGQVFHAPFLNAHPGFRLYAVWERTTKKAESVYPGIRSFHSLEDMLADAQVDLVVVNTPNYTHFDFAKKALLAGKHVLVEKAFTVTVSEAEELVALAGDLDLKLSVYQNRRFDSDFIAVRQVVEQGLLGQIVEAEFHFDRYNLAPSAKRHKETDLPGSGLLHDLGPHIIDQALVLFGMPHSVFASIRTCRPSSRINDYFDISLFYPSLTVRLKGSLIIKEPPLSYALHGYLGSFVKPRSDVQEDQLKAGMLPGDPGFGEENEKSTGILNLETGSTQFSSPTGNYMEFYNQLHAALVNGGRLPVTGEDGLAVMRIIDAAIRANDTRAVVNTDL